MRKKRRHLERDETRLWAVSPLLNEELGNTLSFVFIPGQHSQAELPTFDTCLIAIAERTQLLAVWQELHLACWDENSSAFMAFSSDPFTLSKVAQWSN